MGVRIHIGVTVGKVLLVNLVLTLLILGGVQYAGRTGIHEPQGDRTYILTHLAAGTQFPLMSSHSWMVCLDKLSKR